MCAGVMIYLSGTVPYTRPPFLRGWDLYNYRLMAQAAPHIDFSVCPPYIYRVCGPYLVGLLPIPDPQAFHLAAIALSLVLVVAYFSLLCQLGLSQRSASMATILLTMNRYFFGFTAWDFFQIDDLISELILVLLFKSMFKGNWWKYSILLLVGALSRETVFIIVPATLVYLWESKKLKSAQWPFIAAVLPGLAVFIVLRIVLKSTSPDHEIGLPESGLAYYSWAFSRYLIHFFSPATLLRRLVNAFVPFSFLPVIFLGQTGKFLAKYKHMAVFYFLVFVSTVFGGDAERLMAPSFIVFYFFLGTIIEKTIVAKPFQFIVVVAISFMFTLHHQNARFLLPSQKYTVVLSMGSLCLMTILCVWYRVKHRSQTIA